MSAKCINVNVNVSPPADSLLSPMMTAAISLTSDLKRRMWRKGLLALSSDQIRERAPVPEFSPERAPVSMSSPERAPVAKIGPQRASVPKFVPGRASAPVCPESPEAQKCPPTLPLLPPLTLSSGSPSAHLQPTICSV